MFKVTSKVTTGLDKTNLVKKMIDDLAKQHVYVGIPEESNNLNGDIKNAELLYIHSHGIRSKEMIEEMNVNMGIGADGMPYDTEYNKFLNNMGSGGMSYSAAYQMYIQANGSPLWKSPPRPVIEPAIEYAPNKTVIAKQLRVALDTALSGKDATPELHKAGMLGQQIVQDWFTNPNNLWPENAPSTVKMKGSDRPLIDTGELRRSITFVVRKED